MQVAASKVAIVFRSMLVSGYVSNHKCPDCHQPQPDFQSQRSLHLVRDLRSQNAEPSRISIWYCTSATKVFQTCSQSCCSTNTTVLVCQTIGCAASQASNAALSTYSCTSHGSAQDPLSCHSQFLRNRHYAYFLRYLPILAQTVSRTAVRLALTHHPLPLVPMRTILHVLSAQLSAGPVPLYCHPHPQFGCPQCRRHIHAQGRE